MCIALQVECPSVTRVAFRYQGGMVQGNKGLPSAK